MTHKYRLWLTKEGKPSVLQFLDPDAKPEEAIEYAEIMRKALSHGEVLIVGPEIEVVSA